MTRWETTRQAVSITGGEPARRILPALFFLGLAVAWTWPLAASLSTRVAGGDAGDNLTFLWNVWWTRRAMASPGVGLFETSALFAPYTVSLVLHTHAALISVPAALLSHAVTLVASLNILVLASVTLNGFLTYLLALRLTGDRGAALVAGIVFCTCPFLAAHLLGHFNLVAAWTIPLFLLAFDRATRAPGLLGSALTGALFAAACYGDYYYAVFLAAYAGIWLAGSVLRLSLDRRRSPAASRAARILSWTLVAIGVLSAVILATGGATFKVGSRMIAVHTIHNPGLVATVLLLALLLLKWKPAVGVTWPRDVSPRLLLFHGFVAVAAFTLCAMPLIAGAWSVWRAGDYVSQPYRWRSAPGGVDVAALVGGNPAHPLWGGPSRWLYGTAGIDPVESGAWLGIVPLAAIVWQARSRRVTRNHVVAALFLLWALGPHLLVLGTDAGLVLPWFLARLVPVLANARVPGRAMIMVYLALALIVADTIRRVPSRGKVAIAALALFDFWITPIPLYMPQAPALYRSLPAGSGAVCELPLGVRDGFEELGRFQHETLYYQVVHGRSQSGGFLARVPRVVKDGYARSPLFGYLLELSAGSGSTRPEPDEATVRRELTRFEVGLVVLNGQRASPGLRHFVRTRMPLQLVRSEGEREIYEMTVPAAGGATAAR